MQISLVALITCLLAAAPSLAAPRPAPAALPNPAPAAVSPAAEIRDAGLVPAASPASPFSFPSPPPGVFEREAEPAANPEPTASPVYPRVVHLDKRGSTYHWSGPCTCDYTTYNDESTHTDCTWWATLTDCSWDATTTTCFWSSTWGSGQSTCRGYQSTF